MQRHGPSCLTGPRSRRAGAAFHAPGTSRTPMTPAERQARIERIRREIAAGNYDTPEKFALALDQLMRRLELD
jgi:hypothetical protein